MSWLQKIVTKARPVAKLKFYEKAVACSNCSTRRLFHTLQVRNCLKTSATLKPVATQRYSTSVAIKKREREGLSININGQWRYLNYVWLRDNCRCESCYNHTTFQKIILPAHIDPDIQPAEMTTDDENLMVTWPDGHQSKYNLEWLKKHGNPGSEESNVPQLLWNGDVIKRDFPEEVPYDKFMSSDEGVKDLLASLLRYGIGVVKGAQATEEGTKEVAERVSIIQGTLFSPDIWSFTSDGARSDTAYTSISLGAHNDTTYFSLPCGIQVFQKLEHDGEGGETLLVDGFYAADRLRNDKPDSFNILCEHRIEHQYREEGKELHNVASLAPVLKTHPVTGDLEWIRYNHYDRMPIRTVPLNQLGSYYEALRDLSTLIEDPAGEYWLPLAPGSVLFVDNWRVLHGRASFTGRRRVCGCYLPRDDWISRARTQGLLQ